MPNDSETPPQANSALRRRLGWLGVAAAVIAAGGWWVAGECAGVRNRAVECTMLGEARQISSAAAQIFEQKACGSVPMNALAKCLGPDGRMASGLSVSTDGMHFHEPFHRAAAGDLRKGGVFYVRSRAWSRNRTRIDLLRTAAPDEHTLKFSVDTGQVVP